MFGQELHGGVIPRVGESFLQVVALDGFPLESHPNILGKLAELPCEYRWSSRFIFMDTHEAVRHLEKYRKKWKQKVRGFFDQLFQTNSGRINQHAQDMVDDIDGALTELNGGIVSMGYYTSVIVLFHPERKALAAMAKRVTKAINELGFNARVEDTNTLDAYFGSLPGHCDENVRRPLMNTLNLGDLMPTSSIWSGEPQAPCPFYPALSPALMSCLSSGSAPFWLNLHVRDIGHTIMFGPTGAGKSTHLGMLVAQLRRYQDMSIFFFDKGHSIYPLAMATGGDHYTVGGDGDELAFCPLQYSGHEKRPRVGRRVDRDDPQPEPGAAFLGAAQRDRRGPGKHAREPCAHAHGLLSDHPGPRRPRGHEAVHHRGFHGTPPGRARGRSFALAVHGVRDRGTPQPRAKIRAAGPAVFVPADREILARAARRHRAGRSLDHARARDVPGQNPRVAQGHAQSELPDLDGHAVAHGRGEFRHLWT